MPLDYNNYPPNWLTEIRPAILERAQHHCEFCGVANYSYRWNSKARKWSKIVLTIAHLDHNTENNHSENLRALCQSCHLRYDIEHHKKNAAQTRAAKYQNPNQQILFL